MIGHVVGSLHTARTPTSSVCPAPSTRTSVNRLQTDSDDGTPYLPYYRHRSPILPPLLHVPCSTFFRSLWWFSPSYSVEADSITPSWGVTPPTLRMENGVICGGGVMGLRHERYVCVLVRAQRHLENFFQRQSRMRTHDRRPVNSNTYNGPRGRKRPPPSAGLC